LTRSTRLGDSNEDVGELDDLIAVWDSRSRSSVMALVCDLQTLDDEEKGECQLLSTSNLYRTKGLHEALGRAG
jgi:hypothetical protein